MLRRLPAARPEFEELEQRLLYSADFAPAALANFSFSAGTEPHSLQQLLAPQAAHATAEIAFVDMSLPDAESLVKDLQSQRDAGRPIEIVRIESSEDGIARITAALDGRSDITAVHVLSHGADGVLQLGSVKLDTATLLTRAGELAHWSGALTQDADLMLYGCDVAQTPVGRQFVQDLAALTGADVAASADLTGATALGGNWTLEVRTGSIEAGAALTPLEQSRWSAVLATVQITASQDTYITNGSTINHGTSTSLVVDRSGGSALGNGRALLQFDLSTIPVGATITSATLQMQATQNGGAFNINIYNVTEAWAQGSGNGAVGVANWNQRLPGTNWTAGGGGTFDTTPVATLNTGAVGQHSWDLTSLVQGWYTGSTANNGIIIGSPDSGTTTITYDSREGTTPPRLAITYTLPSAAPVLDPSKNPVLVATNEDAGAPVGAVGTLVSSLVDFAAPPGQVDNVTDPDAGAKLGIAVTAANTTNGSWWYSTNGGANWTALGAPSDSSARLLAADANTRLYFQPNANFNGSITDAITFRAWDQNAGSNGSSVNLIGAVTVADTFSAAAYTNNNGTATWSSAWVENDGRGGGATGGDIRVNGGRVEFRANTVGDSIYRQANLLGATSATLTFDYANTASILNPDWYQIQVSRDGGANWVALGDFTALNTSIGSASYDISSYIASDTRIRFQLLGQFGNPSLYFDNVQIAYSAPLTGGTTAYSNATDTASLVVNPVADTPSVTNATTNEDTQTTSGLVISPNAADGAEVTHFKITGISNGTLYQNDGTTPISNGSFITFAQGNAGLKFTPATNFNGSAAFTVQASTSNADAGLGGGTVNATITVNAVNDAPVNAVPGAQSTNEDTAKVFSSGNGNQISITDVDAGGANNEVTLSVTNGSLTLAGVAGLTFSAGDGTSDATMTFRGTAAAINTALNGLAYVPTPNYSGGATLTLRTLDSTLVSMDIDASLVGHYTFDAGNASDVGPGAAQNGTLVGNAGVVADAVRGQVLNLDGNRDYVQIAGRFGNPANVTLAAWVNFPTTPTFGADVISLGDSAALRVDDLGNLKGYIYNGSSWKNVTYATTLAGTGWHHVAYSFDSVANLQTLYLDGVAVASIAETGSISYTLGANTVVGAHGNAGTTHDAMGKIDDARIYSRALTATEIGNLASDLSLRDTDTVAITVDPVNDAPVITSNGGGAGAAVSIPENTPGVTTVSATDVDGNPLTYSIDAVGDFARFKINATTGALSFLSAPDYETPLDVGADNVYNVTVRVSDGALAATQAIAVTVTNVNEAPVITSNGGGASAALGIAENTTAVAAVAATDVDGNPLTYSIVAGGDSAKFTINPGTGVLRFIAAPDYETPLDIGADNVYNVTVRVSDGLLSDTQAIAVSVTDVGGPLVVTTTNDVLDGNIGSIELLLANPGADGKISLREAISAANNTAGADSFALPAGTYALTLAGLVEDFNANGDLDVRGSLTITGAGAASTVISGSGNFSVLDIVSGNASISGVTISDGATVLDGAGINVFSGASLALSQAVVRDNVTSSDGGGILNQGALTLTDVEIRDNTASAKGGGIQHIGTALTLNRVTLAGNDASKGGGLFADGSVASLTNVTLSANTAGDKGGGIWLKSDATLLNTTIANNSAFKEGGGIFVEGGGTNVTLRNVLLANNTGGNLNDDSGSSNVTSLGNNLSDTNTPELNQPSDLKLTPAGLLALADNGGFTRTHALLLTSAAVDAGNTAAAPATDQRGAPRQGAAADIGAYESPAPGDRAPVNTVPGSISVVEDVASAIPGISVGDPDEGSGFASYELANVALSVANGTLQVTPSGAVSVSANNSANLTLSGNQADINATLASLIYRGVANYNGNDTLVVVSRDGVGLADTDSVAIAVGAVNDPPRGTDATLFVNKNSGLTLARADFGFVDAPGEGNGLSSVVVRLPSAGMLLLNGTPLAAATEVTVAQLDAGQLVYAPATGASGTAYATLRFQVRDDGGTANGGVDLDPVQRTLTFDVGNRAPIVISDGGGGSALISIGENTTAVTTVSAADPDGDPLTYGIVGGADAALFTIDAVTGVLAFGSAPNFEAPADADANNVYEVIVRAVDIDGAIGTQALNVSVTNVNEAPVLVQALPDQGATQDVPFAFTFGAGTFNDIDAGDTLTYSAALSDGSALPGWLSFNGAARTFSGTPGNVDVGAVDVRVTATDGSGASVFDDFTLAVSNVNDAPTVAAPIAAQVATEDAPFAFTFGAGTFNDIDAGDTLTYSAALSDGSALPGWLSFDGATRTFSGTPGNANVGASAVRVTATDTTGASVFDDFSLAVGNVNDAPSGTDLALDVSRNGRALARADFGFNDAPGESNAFAAVLVQLPSAGTLRLNGVALAAASEVTVTQLDAGELVFMPVAGASGASYATIGFQVRDDGGTANAGLDLDPVQRKLTINVVNQAPVISSDGGGAAASAGVPENLTTVTTVAASDPDADALTYSIVGGADAVRFSIDSATGVLTFIVAPNYEAPNDAGADNVYDVTVQVSDGILTDSQDIAVTVTPVNDATPVITSNGGAATASINVAENTTAVTTVTATDADLPAQALSYSISGGADAARFIIDGATGALSFVVAPNFEAPTDAGADNVYEVTVQVSDGTLMSNQAITVSVGNVNDNAPLITANSLSISEGGIATPVISSTDLDNGGAQLGYIVSGLSGGRLELTSAPGVAVTTFTQADVDAGLLRFVSDGGEAAPAYQLTVSDGVFSTGPQGASLTFANVNDAPVITSDGGGPVANLTTAENATAVTIVTASDPDAASVLRFAISGGADAAHFAIDHVSGALQFISAPDHELPTDANANNTYEVIVSVSDGSLSAQQLLVVDVANVNEAPTITTNSLVLSTSGATVILLGTDPDTAAAALNYQVSGLVGGHFEMVATPGLAVGGFSQAQVNAGAVRFVEDGSGATPTYLLTLTDGVSTVTSGAPDVVLASAPAPALVPDTTPVPAATTAQVPSPDVAPSLAAKDVTAIGSVVPDLAPMREGSLSTKLLTDMPAPALGWIPAPAPAPVAMAGPLEVPSPRNSSQAPQAPLEFALPSEGTVAHGRVALDGDVAAALRERGLAQELDRLRNTVAEFQQSDKEVIASSAMVSAGLSVGYVLWLARGGVLVASLMSALPAWAMVDPMPVLAQMKRRDGEQDGEEDDNDDEANDPIERLFSKARSIMKREGEPTLPASAVTAAQQSAPKEQRA